MTGHSVFKRILPRSFLCFSFIIYTLFSIHVILCLRFGGFFSGLVVGESLKKNKTGSPGCCANTATTGHINDSLFSVKVLLATPVVRPASCRFLCGNSWSGRRNERILTINSGVPDSELGAQKINCASTRNLTSPSMWITLTTSSAGSKASLILSSLKVLN